MSRTESHVDGMLRHLGAAYYDSLQGRATQADVNRALDNVAAQLNEQALHTAPDAAAAGSKAAHGHRGGREAGFHGWSRRVSDVMAASVVTVDRATPYKEIARLLADPGEADVAVRDGIATLTGTLDPTTGAHGDLIPVAIRLMWDVDGVVDIIDRLGQSQPPTSIPITERQAR